MRKAALSLAGIVLVWGAGIVWAGEAAPAPAPDADALKKQMAELKEKAKGVQAKLDAAYTKIAAAPDMVKLAEAKAKAATAFEDARKADKDVTAATQAAGEATAALDKRVQDKLAASDQAKPLLADLAGAAQKKAGLEYDAAIAGLELNHASSPTNFALDHDPELAKARKAAFETADKEARAKALKAYDEARKAKRDAMPDAQKALARIEADKKALDELAKADSAARMKLGDLRGTIAKGDDADVKAARDRRAATQKAMMDASNGEALKPLRKARDDAFVAYDAKQRDLRAADPDVAALKKERDALNAQMGELDKKLREATK